MRVCTAAVAAFIVAVRGRHRLNYVQTGGDPAPDGSSHAYSPLPGWSAAGVSGGKWAGSVVMRPAAAERRRRGPRDGRAEQGTHARGCAPPPLLPSSLLFLCLLRRHPCSQHAENTSTKHGTPWHSSPTLRGQLGGESELNRGQAASQWPGEPLLNAVDADNETGKPSRAHMRGHAPPPLQPSSMLTGGDTD